MESCTIVCALHFPRLQDLQKEVARLSSGSQSLEEELTGWRQKVESLENTNFDLQERLVAIGSLVDAVRSEISDYCPSNEEAVSEGEGEVEEEEKGDYRIQENRIEGRLQLVMTGCSRITEDLSTLQLERDELQMVSRRTVHLCMYVHMCAQQLPFLHAVQFSLFTLFVFLCLFPSPHLSPFPFNLPLPLFSLPLSYHRAWKPPLSCQYLTQNLPCCNS